jgi:hypothetical protein
LAAFGLTTWRAIAPLHEERRRPGGGDGDGDPTHQLEKHHLVPVVIEVPSVAVDLPAVVLDRDPPLGVGAVDLPHAAADDHADVALRGRQPCRHQGVHDPVLPGRLADTSAAQPVGDHLESGPVAPWERFGQPPGEIVSGHPAVAHQVVGRLLEHPVRNEEREVDQGADRGGHRDTRLGGDIGSGEVLPAKVSHIPSGMAVRRNGELQRRPGDAVDPEQVARRQVRHGDEGADGQAGGEGSLAP